MAMRSVESEHTPVRPAASPTLKSSLCLEQTTRGSLSRAPVKCLSGTFHASAENPRNLSKTHSVDCQIDKPLNKNVGNMEVATHPTGLATAEKEKP